MGNSPIMPCYDVERLETKTHVGLGPRESIKYTKHRVSLEQPFKAFKKFKAAFTEAKYVRVQTTTGKVCQERLT